MIRVYIQTQNKPINDSDLFENSLILILVSFSRLGYNKTPDFSSNLLEPAFYIWL